MQYQTFGALCAPIVLHGSWFMVFLWAPQTKFAQAHQGHISRQNFHRQIRGTFLDEIFTGRLGAHFWEKLFPRVNECFPPLWSGRIKNFLIEICHAAKPATFLFTQLFYLATQSWRKTAKRIGFGIFIRRTHRQTDTRKAHL